MTAVTGREMRDHGLIAIRIDIFTPIFKTTQEDFLKRLSLIALLFVLAFALPAYPQCPTLVDSPVLSTSPDDVPPAENAWLINDSGVAALARPNHQVAFIQTGPNEQKIWFSLDFGVQDNTPAPTWGVFYNRRYRADANSPWYWEFTNSKSVTSFSAFVDAVLYSPTAKYYDQYGQPHKYIMFLVNQPQACDGPIAGFAMESFSDNGTCWTPMIPMNHLGGPSADCAPELGSDLVQTEAFGAIDGGNTIYLVGVEGDNTSLIPYYNMWSSALTFGTVSVYSPWSLQLGPYYSGSSSGIFLPVDPTLRASYPADPNRYQPYAYFENMALAWDEPNGDLYISRGYPYPYDRRNDLYNCCNVPSWRQQGATFMYNYASSFYQKVGGCGTYAPALYPNRYQVYKMHLGTLSNWQQLYFGTWTLLSDNGNSAGYESNITLASTPLVMGQTNGGRDAGAASFLLDNTGRLVRNGGYGTVFAGSTLHEKLSIGPCRQTGNERIVANQIP